MQQQNLWLGVLLGLVAAACTSQVAPERGALPDLTTTTTSPTRTTAIATSAVDAERLADIAGRILVLRSDSSIVSMRADGSDLIEHAAADENVTARSQPTWSPEGSLVAWTEQIGEDSYELVIADANDGGERRSAAPMLAQYIDWSPNADSVAFMGNDFWGAMTLAFADVGSDAEIIDTGAPMYIDWSPTGETLLVHVEDRLERIDPLGTYRDLVDTDGSFRVGLHYGDQLLYSVKADTIGELLIATEISGEPAPVMRFTAPTALVPDPTTGRIAAMSTWNAEAVRFAESPPADFPALIPEQLSILDPATRELTVVHEGRAVSWSWSPDGGILLFSTVEFIGDSQKIVWHTWDGATTTRHDTFTPTSQFGNSYLAFFDQHERSTTRWSPDSMAFVYAGGVEGGPSGIWIQPLDGGDPVLVADGIDATWSRGSPPGGDS